MATLGRRVQIGEMLWVYGALLTEKQRLALTLHYDEDMSLGEIAQQFGVSRQNVFELMTRGERLLSRYEDTLGVAKLVRDTASRLSEAIALLEQDGDTQSILALLRGAQAALEGEEHGV